MSKDKETFLKELRQVFRQEADENIKSMAARLVELENTTHPAQRAEIVETLFRDSHNLKGAARSVDQDQGGMELICQSLESIFKKFKKEEILPEPVIFDALHRAVDHLGQLNKPGAVAIDVSAIAAELQQIDGAETPPPAQAAGERIEKTGAGETGKKSAPAAVRLSVEKLTAVMLQAEELILGKSIMEKCNIELKELSAEVEMLQKTWKHLSGAYSAAAGSVPGAAAPISAVVLEKLRRLEQQHSARLKQLCARTAELSKNHETNRRLLTGQIEAHLEDIKNVLMLPFFSTAVVLPKMARDLARAGGKEVQLVVKGGEIEIDKKILEAIKDPLIHLVRNAVDHGIEAPEIRTAAGKPARGRVEVSAVRKQGNKIEIVVSDDGTGMDLQKIKEKELKNGRPAGQETEIPEQEQILSIISRSGFSTCPIITDLSGRGLGMAIVREKVEKLAGTVAMETQPGRGTTFHLVIPAAVATFRGIHIETAGRRFIVPTLNVIRVLRIDPAQIRTVENRETVLLSGRPISYVDLKDVLEIEAPAPRQRRETQETQGKKREFQRVLVLEAAGKTIAFQVDQVHGEGEVLQKNLGSRLQRVINVSGAAILGPHEVVPILEPADLVQEAVKKAAHGRKRTTAPAPPPQKSILVVEDSITSRTLFRNILEAAGYQVKTAAHGRAAWTLLQAETVAAVVSDIEMPHMDGIELTAKIRGDKKLTALPVVLVTTLEKKEDRERGIDAGADAYIVKSDFKQSNLLSVLEQLI